MRASQAFALALCLAFPLALAACGGGGGGTPAKTATPEPAEPMPTEPEPAEPEPAEPMPEPSAGDVSKFFPTTASQAIAFGTTRVYYYDIIDYGHEPWYELPSGSVTLANAVYRNWKGDNFPQFNEFNFGSATNSNGIPIQKATASQADRYAAIAYQAILDHSMFIVQGGIYNYATGDDPRCLGTTMIPVA